MPVERGGLREEGFLLVAIYDKPKLRCRNSDNTGKMTGLGDFEHGGDSSNKDLESGKLGRINVH